MPDRWGRVTGEDFFDVAKAAHGLTRDQQTRNDDAEVDHALGIMNESGDFELFDGLGISPRNKARADEIYAKSRVAKQLGDDADLARQQTQLENEYLGMAAKAQTPEERLNVLGQINPDSLAGARALANVQKQVMGSQDNQVALLGTVLKKGQAEYDAVLRPALVSAQDQLSKGDRTGAANTLAAVSKILPQRGEWRTEQDGQGNVLLRRFHNERNAGLTPQNDAAASTPGTDVVQGIGIGNSAEGPAGGIGAGGAQGGGQGLGLGFDQGKPATRPAASADHYSPTDDVVSVDDALAALGKMSSKDYALQMAAHRVTNMDFNAKALESGGHMGVDKNGQKVRVVPLINPSDSTRQFAVFNARGQSLAPDPDNPNRKAWTSDEFFNSGIQIVNKEQRALDNDDRRVRNDERRTSVEERRLGMQEQALGLRGAKAKTPVDEGYAEYQKGVAESAQHDPLSLNGSAEDAGKRRLAEFTQAKYGRAMTLDELRVMGSGGGGSAQQAAPPARAANPAQEMWRSFKSK